MVILITHVFGYANKGDWVLLESLLLSLKRCFPGAVLRGICRDPVAQRTYFPNVQWYYSLSGSCRRGLARQAENTIKVLGGLIRYTFPHLSKHLGWGNTASPACYEGVDIIVTCPGGYLEDSNVSVIPNLLNLWFAVRTGVPVIMAPQSIGPFHTIICRKAAAALLKRTACVCVREQESERIAIDQLRLPSSLVRRFPDMAFFWWDSSDCDVDKEFYELGIGYNEKFACMTLIDWYFPFDSDPKDRRNAYITQAAETVRLLKSKLGLRTLLLKQIETGAGISGDDEILRTVSSLAGPASICTLKNYPPPVMREIIKRAEVFIGSRMHSSIFALQVGTPVVAIGYLPKTSGIMKMFGLQDYVCDISKVTSQLLLEMSRTAISDKARFLEAKEKARELGEKGRRRFEDLIVEVAKPRIT